jgi:enamine deaminase RidA (YjgF/YER057c/UK114 family)
MNPQHRWRHPALAAVAVAILGMAALARPGRSQTPTPPRDQLSFYGSPSSPISSGVVIPPGRAVVWTSGTVPPVRVREAAVGSRERFGDTRTQAAGVLDNIEEQLKKQGLGLRDVVYLRAYLVPDAAAGGKLDVQGWSAVYGERFGTAANPTKPARSTVGVTALVNPDWLIEIEAFAVFPLK